jgi:hypothetical protein
MDNEKRAFIKADKAVFRSERVDVCLLNKASDCRSAGHVGGRRCGFLINAFNTG